MSIKDKYTVRSIDTFQCKEWLLYKHYAKRIPSISYSFGIFDAENILQGVCTFGSPPMSQQRLMCGEKYADIVLELNRHVINNKPNLASYFISSCLKLLPSPSIIISYADKDFGHNGYIYQATNFIYCGETQYHPNDITSKNGLHLATIMDKTRGKKNRTELVKTLYADQIEMKARSQKHKYLYFIGSKTEKKHMLSALTFDILPYPKGDNKPYDASYKTLTQFELFT